MSSSSGNASYTAIKRRRKLKIIKVFHSATSIDKMVKSFKEMEKVFDESNLAYGCWKIACKLMDQGQSPEQVISFANRALQILIDNGINNIPCFGDDFMRPPISIGKCGTLCSDYHKSSLYIAYLFVLLASACLKLERVKDALSYLDWSNENLTKLEEDGDSSCASYCLLNTLLCNQEELYNLKLYMCRFEEAVVPLRKKLVILETMMEEGCLEIGKTNEQLCANHMMILKYKEALPFCLKALEIYKKQLGPNSVEVAKTMRRLALIYNGFKEYDKALEQNQLSLDILRNAAPNSPDFLKGEGDTGCILVGLSRYKEAIDVLERGVSRPEMEDKTRFLAYVNMATAFYYLGKRAEAKKHMRTAQILFEKKEISTRSAASAIAFMDMSVLYENMNDFGRATSLLTRALSMPFIPQKFLLEGSARLFSLISISGKEKEGIAYMEDAVEILKSSFGPEHCEVGYAYKNMGATCLKSGQEELAVKFLVKAKDILDVTLGSHHVDALKTSHTLAQTYVTLRRYELAIEMQEGVVEGLKRLGQSEQENLDEVVSLLGKMEIAICAADEKIAIGVDTGDFSVTASKCGISENV